MPFKKGDRPNWYVRRKNLPGFGDSGTLSTRTTRVDRAREMEKLLDWLADEEMFDLLEALRPVGKGASGRVTLPDVLRAKKDKRLDDFRRTLRDPNLHEALKTYIKQNEGNYDIELGIRHILARTPANVRLSWLTSPKNINDITAKMLSEGYKPNSIKNHVWTAISKLFQHEFGIARARDILAEAKRPGEDDSRDVWLTPAEVYAVVSACEWEVRMFVLLSSTLGIDVTPVLRIRVRDIDFDAWRLQVEDTKNKARRRPVDLPPVAAFVLSLMAEGKSGTDLLFTLTQGQIGHRWRRAREAAGLTVEKGFKDDVRLKDLRHTFAVHYVKSGGNIAALMQRMGHTRGDQSLAYAKHQAKGSKDMTAAAEAMGLVLPDHLAAALQRPELATEEALEIPDWWFDRNAGPTSMARYTPRGTAGWGTEDYNARRRAAYAQARAEGKTKAEAKRASVRKVS